MSKKDIAEIFKAYGDTRVIQWPFECGESETCVGLLDYYYMQWFIHELEKSVLYGENPTEERHSFLFGICDRKEK